MPEEVPTPEPNPSNNPDPQPGDGKPKAPPPTEDGSAPQAPIELPGKSNPPERV